MLLRGKSVSHLGQVRLAILEHDGQLSIYYFPDGEVKYGLPIIPSRYEDPLKVISGGEYYSCTNCSHTTVLQAGSPPSCSVCDHKEWVDADKVKRVT